MGELKSVILNKDVQWAFFFNIKLKCKFLDKVLPAITYIGSAAVTISICILLIGMGNTEVGPVSAFLSCSAISYVISINNIILLNSRYEPY